MTETSNRELRGKYPNPNRRVKEGEEEEEDAEESGLDAGWSNPGQGLQT